MKQLWNFLSLRLDCCDTEDIEIRNHDTGQKYAAIEWWLDAKSNTIIIEIVPIVNETTKA